MTLLSRILLLVCLALAPALAIQWYQRTEVQSAVERKTQEESLRILALVEGQLGSLIEGVRQTMTVLSETMAVRQQNGPACRDLLQRLSASFLPHEAIHVTDRNGVVWCSNVAEVVGMNQSERLHVQEALASKRFVVGSYITRRINQEPALPFALPYRTMDGGIGGVVVAVLEARVLAKIMTMEALPPGSLVTLADRNGRVLICAPALRPPGGLLEEHRLAVLNAADRGTIVVHDGDGVDRLVAFSPLKKGTSGLFLSVGLDRWAELAGARVAAYRGLALLAFDLVAALVLTTLAYRRFIHRPLASIHAAALHWRAGDYSPRPNGANCREFRDLFQTFAEMAAAVAGREKDQRARLAAEQAASQTKEILAIALEAADAGWWAWDIKNDVVTISRECARLQERGSPGEVTTLADWLANVHPEDRERVKAARRHMHRLEYRVLVPPNGIRWIYSIGRTTLDAHGQPERTMGISVDITQQKRLEAELVAAKHQADEANRHKTSFLAGASHDLRQPVQSLMLFTSVLAGRSHDPKDQIIIERIGGAIKSLKALLDGLLDISRLDAGNITPQLADIPLQPLLAQIATEYEMQACNRGLRFTVVPTSLWVRSDAALLDRVLRNLVENAIKYTKQGGILIGCRRRGETACLEVIDTGIGIPEDKLKQVFEEFHQLDNPEHDIAKGLGLGLAIVSRLSLLLDHRITVSSQIGHGTRFAVAVPRASASLAQAGAAENTEGILPACVVLIEDEEVVRDGLESQLRDWGVDVLSGADDRIIALHLGRRRPDLIIADYRLRGGLTGVQAVHRLTAAIGAPIPAVLLTGETDPHCLADIRASGLAVLHKPLQPADLRREMSRMAQAG